jgi:hypothetical protein
MKHVFLFLFTLTILACNTPAPTELPATAQTQLPVVIDLPTTSQPPTVETTPPTLEAPTTDPHIYGSIRIDGSPEFIAQTRAALSLLESNAPDAHLKVQTYVGIIQQGQHSGMWAGENPPRYEVGDATAFYSVTWYASTIAHDATHSELYIQYAAAHPGEAVPEQAWGGVEIERFCNGYQLDILQRIGTPQNEIDYMSTLDGTHCDVDHDGDCDWDDYNNRGW